MWDSLSIYLSIFICGSLHFVYQEYIYLTLIYKGLSYLATLPIEGTSLSVLRICIFYCLCIIMDRVIIPQIIFIIELRWGGCIYIMKKKLWNGNKTLYKQVCLFIKLTFLLRMHFHIESMPSRTKAYLK